MFLFWISSRYFSVTFVLAFSFLREIFSRSMTVSFAFVSQILVVVFQLLKLWPQLVSQFLHFFAGFVIFSSIDFQSANACFNKSMDYSCFAFLAADFFKLSRSASSLAPRSHKPSFVAFLALSLSLFSFCPSSTNSSWSEEFVLFSFFNWKHWFCSSS